MNKNTKMGLALGTTLALLTSSSMFAYADSLTRQLQMGMSGSDVGVLQTFLARDPNIYPQGRITNFFWTLTRAAVVNFQIKNGIAPVGRVGPQTLGVINAQMSTIGGVVTGAGVAPISAVTVVNNNNGTINLNWKTPTLITTDAFPMRSTIVRPF